MDLGVFLYFVYIAVGFVLLIKGADFLVNGASSLAKRFNVSDIAIGLTVVAMGTSAPELVVNIISGAKGDANGIIFGNIIGSNIFNVFLILGISAIIYPLTVQKNALWKEVPYSFFVAVLFVILVNDGFISDLFNNGSTENVLSVSDGWILMGLFLVFILYIFMNLKRHPEEIEGEDVILYGSLKTTVMILFGIAGLIFGGQMIVDNAVKIAKIFEVSDELIGLTILAAGTSLPELATSAVAAFQKKSDLAVGNIVGSNIFNLFLVLGATAVISGDLAFDVALNWDLGF
ncbi:MAG: calcium/sodium antiporter, partial [Cyclobacteriaceae bacterium]